MQNYRMQVVLMQQGVQMAYSYEKKSPSYTWVPFVAIPAGILILWWILRFFMVAPGHVGVVVNLFGDDKGISVHERGVGMHWIAPWKKIYIFPTFEQNYTWEGQLEAFSFQTSEGMACSADIGITYHLRPGEIHTIFNKYRRGMTEITEIFVRNYIRDAINKAASKMKIEDLYGSGKEKFFDDVQNQVQDDLRPIGIEVHRIYLIGRFHFPQNVITALNAKIEAVQRAQQRENELRESEAQAKKNIAQAEGESQSRILKATAEARSNEMIAESLSQDLLIYEAIQKWNGALPQVMSDSTPMIDLRRSDDRNSQ
jgi:regulator of protease activity HflC (stomatin/prohibitin superfamily)